MVRDRLNRIFASKAFYIVFSLLAAIALWVFVELSQNPTGDVMIDANVVFLNEDLLNDRNFVKTGVSPETITLKINCRRELHRSLSNSTVYVTVDLANVTSVGVIPLAYEIVIPPNINKGALEISKSVDKVIVNVDRMYEKEIYVRGEYKGGTASEDLIAGPAEFSPATVVISGPEAAVSRVDHAWVPIQREKLSKTLEEEFTFVLRDLSGAELTEEQLEGVKTSQETVRVTIPIKMKKDIALTVDLVPGAGASAQNAKVTIKPPTITISGEPDAVRDFNTITLNTIDLSSFDLTTTQTFSIPVPNGFVNESGETEASVTVELIGLETRHFIVTNLQTVNKPRGMTESILTSGLDVRIRGRAEELDKITPMNIRVLADLSDYKEGSSTVPVKISIDGDYDIGPIGEYWIAITLSAEE